MKARPWSPASFNATIRQFASTAGIDYSEAGALTRLLTKQGVVKDTGEVVKPSNGRGKGSKVFTYPNKVSLDFLDDGTSEDRA